MSETNDALPLAAQALIPYTIALRQDYRPAKLHRDIAEKLEAVERGEIKRLMMFVPPRHGKSMLTSEHFPPWYLGRNPSRFVVTATYGQDLADDFGRKVRGQMLDPLYRKIFPNASIDPDSASVSRINTQQNGSYFAVGIGGALTGRGADILIVDDPHKDRLDADSIIMRKRAKDWFQSVAYTRLMPGGSIVVMQTRWHEDDLAGWLLREHGDEEWTILSVPAEPAPWPESFPEEKLQKIRRMLGPRDWSALYMQNPVPGGGGEFHREWLRYHDGDAGDGTNKYLLVDPAGETRPENDFTSMWVVGLGADGNYRWVDGIRDRLNLTERGAAVMRLHRKHKPLQVRYERYGMMADVQYIQELQKRENYYFDVVEVAGKLKKNDRIRRLVPLFEGKKFLFPPTLSYTDKDKVPRDLVHTFIEEEYAAFPAGLHDDMLDALSRIAEPDMPLIWPSQEMEEKRERYAANEPKTSAWAA